MRRSMRIMGFMEQWDMLWTIRISVGRMEKNVYT